MVWSQTEGIVSHTSDKISVPLLSVFTGILRLNGRSVLVIMALVVKVVAVSWTQAVLRIPIRDMVITVGDGVVNGRFLIDVSLESFSRIRRRTRLFGFTQSVLHVSFVEKVQE